MPIYKVTFKFNLPVRPDITVEVTGENAEEVDTNAHIAAGKRGVIFGPCGYNTVPTKIEEIK